MLSLPMEFSNLGLDPGSFRMGDRKSARGPCISCGGHNRMVIFVDHPFPKWWIRCDLCGLEGWVDQYFPEIRSDGCPTDFARDIELSNDTFAREVEEKVEHFRSASNWRMYHENMTPDNRAWWVNQGIPQEWQDFWGLGYRPSHYFMVKDQIYTRPAYTMPKFGPGWVLNNIDYRIVDPPLGAGKYRPSPGIPAAAFYARPDIPSISEDGRVVIVEGSKKAMVLCINLGVQVIGIPGCKSWAGIVKVVKDLDLVVVVLDPDAEVAARDLTTAIGKHAVRLVIPSKPDDAFINGWLDEDRFWKMVKQSGKRG